MAEDFDLASIFDAKDLKRITKRLNDISTGSGLQRRALKVAGLRLTELIREGVVQGGLNPESGTPGFWAPTVVGNDPLQNSGAFLASINPTLRGQGESMEVLVGTNVPYMKYHEQPGNKLGFIEYPPTLKQRAFLFFKFGWRLKKDTKIRIPTRRTFVTPRTVRSKVIEVYRDVLLTTGGK